MAGDGSNTKLTDENRLKLKEAAALDASVAEMAYYCNVTNQTVYNWLNGDKDLFDEITRLRERPVLKARQTIIKSLDDPEQSKWYLSRKRKKEFSERSEQDITSAGKPIPLLYAISSNNSTQEDTGTQEENQGDTGGNISQ